MAKISILFLQTEIVVILFIHFFWNAYICSRFWLASALDNYQGHRTSAF